MKPGDALQSSSTRRSVHVVNCGAEALPVVMIDNFAPDPEKLAAEAEKAAFGMLGQFYPGPRAKAPRNYIASVADVLAPVVKEIFGGRTSLNVERALFSIATTAPKDLTLAQRIPHFDDARENALAIVHYLAAGDFGGTAFYRHRSTGFESVNIARKAPYFASLKVDLERKGEPAPAYIDGDTPLFERLMTAPAVFNRAVLYWGRQLHCAVLPNHSPLPASPKEGRLTIASFLSIE